jgi:hypothetical protein
MVENRGVQRSLQGATLVDLLDRVLDKGLVVAGDIVVQLADVELLTVKIRLLVCSVDKAQEIGMDWWRHDTFLTSSATPKLFEKKKPESSIQTKTIGGVMRERKANKKNSKTKIQNKKKR